MKALFAKLLCRGRVRPACKDSLVRLCIHNPHTNGFFAILQQSRYGQMSRMGRISPYVVHRVELAVERDVELFFRIGIQPDLNLPNKRDFGRQGFYPFLESAITFFLRSASISGAN